MPIDETKLAALKAMLEEDGDCRALTDAQLTLCLERADGDLRGAAYQGALIKAENDEIALPDGTRLPGNRERWLTIARMYRPNKGRAANRADAPDAR